VLAADTVPAGRYAREVLRNLARAGAYGPGYADRTLSNVVSEEENVKSVLVKVQLGEADAGIVYRSDVTAANASALRTIEIPDSANVTAAYPIAVSGSAPAAGLARDFVDLVLSATGQRVLASHGFVPATAAAGAER
jgi:molybdate transport system substrate-binding protein